jgi:protein tyrosine phosphatase
MGPLPVTVEHFWRMVFEQNVTLILSVCNLSEGGRVKCHKFWPDSCSLEDPAFKKIAMKDVHVK